MSIMTNKQPKFTKKITEGGEDEYIDNRDYWNQYYRIRGCPESPSRFAEYVGTIVKSKRTLVDLGCGNGRDAVFFAELGLHVTALDMSRIAINCLNTKHIPNAEFICDDFITSKCHTPERYDYAYSRFTLHAVNEKQETLLLRKMHRSLKPGGKLFIEVRSIHDPLYGKGMPLERNAFFYDDHYRRFIVLHELLEHLETEGYIIEYAKEQSGFAPYGSDDPLIIRVIAAKPES